MLQAIRIKNGTVPVFSNERYAMNANASFEIIRLT